MQKKCPRCLKTKDYSLFYKSSYTKKGIQTYCIICCNQMGKIKRENLKKNGPTIIRDSKVCLTCKTKKPIGQFPVMRTSHDGRISYCKPCWVKYVQAAQRRQSKQI
jgi:hypothetical protein